MLHQNSNKTDSSFFVVPVFAERSPLQEKYFNFNCWNVQTYFVPSVSTNLSTLTWNVMYFSTFWSLPWILIEREARSAHLVVWRTGTYGRAICTFVKTLFSHFCKPRCLEALLQWHSHASLTLKIWADTYLPNSKVEGNQNHSRSVFRSIYARCLAAIARLSPYHPVLEPLTQSLWTDMVWWYSENEMRKSRISVLLYKDRSHASLRVILRQYKCFKSFSEITVFFFSKLLIIVSIAFVLQASFCHSETASVNSFR